jgi:hypothetical protein
MECTCIFIFVVIRAIVEKHSPSTCSMRDRVLRTKNAMTVELQWRKVSVSPRRISICRLLLVRVNVQRRVFELWSTPFTRLLPMIPSEITSAGTHYARPHTSWYFSRSVNLIESALERPNGIVSALYVLLLFKVSMHSLFPQMNQ